MEVKYLYEIKLSIGLGEDQEFDFFVAAMNPEEAEKMARESMLEDHAAWMENTGVENIAEVVEQGFRVPLSPVLEQMMGDDNMLAEFMESLSDPQMMGERYAKAIMNARMVLLVEMGKIII